MLALGSTALSEDATACADPGCRRPVVMARVRVHKTGRTGSSVFSAIAVSPRRIEIGLEAVELDRVVELK